MWVVWSIIKFINKYCLHFNWRTEPKVFIYQFSMKYVKYMIFIKYCLKNLPMPDEKDFKHVANQVKADMNS